MIGILKFSSKVRYGKNKRNIPFYCFYSNETKLIVASKLGYKNKVDHYAIVDIINTKCNPNRGAIKYIIGPVNDYNSSLNYILYKNLILPRKPLQVNIKNDHDTHRIDLTKLDIYSIDPITTNDVDDAFHFKFNKDILEIGIHITDLSNIRDPVVFSVIFVSDILFKNL